MLRLRLSVSRNAATHARRHSSVASSPDFKYQKLIKKDVHYLVPTKFDLLSKDLVSIHRDAVLGREFVIVKPEALTLLAKTALTHINHYFRKSHLKQVASIIADPEATDNDKFVATSLLQNAITAAGGVLPSCQDTGTATVSAYRGQNVLTDGKDELHISKGIFEAYQEGNLRFSQVAPLTMFEERNTGTNLPAQIDVHAYPGNVYDFLFVCKGGGSANKTALYQKTKATLKRAKFLDFIMTEVRKLGTAACPPYHLAIVVGGLSAEMNLKTAKLLSCGALDQLPRTGNKHGRAFRDEQWEMIINKCCQDLGIGAQFGGKYFVHDVRVARLPRHGASCPVSIAVSCSADRQVLGRIDRHGVWIEKLEKNPARFLPATPEIANTGDVRINLDQGDMKEVLAELTRHPVSKRVLLTGHIIVARDIAHSRMADILDETGSLPDYMYKYPVYYAGPAKKPDGKASGSFGPTTSGRMDAYVDKFQSVGGSLVMIGKGNRQSMVTKSCQKNGGFYLGSPGGIAAALAETSIKSVEVLDMEELGMEAVWKVKIEDFPAFLIVDDKGNDFFEEWMAGEVHAEIDSEFEELADLFHFVDGNNHGFASALDLAEHYQLTEEEAEELIKEQTSRHKGVGLQDALDTKDFIRMVKEHPELQSKLKH